MDEKMIVKGIRNRNQVALMEVIERYAPLVKSIVSKALKYNQYDIEDCISDSFLKAWENIDQYDEEKGSFKNWLGAIAKYQALDYLKKSYYKQESLSLMDKDLIV